MFKLEGFDELSKSLNELSKRTQELDGSHEIPFDELFNDDFMAKYTNSKNIDVFLKGLNISSQEEFDNIDIDLLNDYVKSNSQFPSWEEMAGKAGEIWISTQLFNGL